MGFRKDNVKLNKSFTKAGVVLGATIMATGVGVTTTTALATDNTTAQTATASQSKGVQISAEVLDRYSARCLAQSIDFGSMPKHDDLRLELLNDEGKVINPSHYKFKIERVDHQMLGDELPLEITVKITLDNGQEIQRVVYLPQNIANGDSKEVKINDIKEIEVSRYENNTDEGIENFVLEAVRSKIFNNHKGTLTINTKGNIHGDYFHCDATLTYAGKKYTKNNIGVHCKADLKSNDEAIEVSDVKNNEKEKEKEKVNKEKIDKEKAEKERQNKARENNTFPTIKGKDLTLEPGKAFNKDMLQLSAYDKEDGDLTSKLKISGLDKINVNKEGIYEIKTWVSDKDGAETVKYFKVKIEKPQEKEVTRQFDLSFNGFGVEEGTKLTEKDVFKLSHLKANDSVAGDMTDKIKITNLKDIDTNKIGEQAIKIEVVNGAGKLVKGEVPVNVVKRQSAVLSFEVIDNSTGKVMKTSDKFEYGVGKVLTKADLPKDLIGDYRVDKLLVNGLDSDKIGAPIIPGTNMVTVYLSNPNAPKPLTNEKGKQSDKIKNIAKNTPPVITGQDVTVVQGQPFKLDMLKLKAIDVEDGDVSNSIDMISSNVDTRNVGTYKVEVSAKDKDGATVTSVFAVNVISSSDGVDSNAVEVLNNKANKTDKAKENKQAKVSNKAKHRKALTNSDKAKLYQTGEEEDTAGVLKYLLCFTALTGGLSFDFMRSRRKTSKEHK